jgi:uncharacterized membrane protein YccC
MTADASCVVAVGIASGLAILWVERRWPRTWKAIIRAVNSLLFEKGDRK